MYFGLVVGLHFDTRMTRVTSMLLDNDIDAFLHSADKIEKELHKKDPSNPILSKETYSPPSVSPRMSKQYKTSKSCDALVMHATPLALAAVGQSGSRDVSDIMAIATIGSTTASPRNKRLSISWGKSMPKEFPECDIQNLNIKLVHSEDPIKNEIDVDRMIGVGEARMPEHTVHHYVQMREGVVASDVDCVVDLGECLQISNGNLFQSKATGIDISSKKQ